MIEKLPNWIILMGHYAIALIIAIASFYGAYLLLIENINFYSVSLTFLIVLSVIISLHVHRKINKSISLLKTTVSTFIITFPAQEYYMYKFATEQSKEVVKAWGLIVGGFIVVIFALWLYASYLETMRKNHITSPFNLAVSSIYVAIGYIVVNYKSIYTHITGWIF